MHFPGRKGLDSDPEERYKQKTLYFALRITQYVRIVQGVVDVQLRVVLGQARGN